jgi:hypothetical protein
MARLLLGIVRRILILGIHLPLVHVVHVVLGDGSTVGLGIPELLCVGRQGAVEDNDGGDCQHDNDDEVDYNSLERSLGWGVRTILPNNISWLRGPLHVNLMVEQLVVVLVVTQLDVLVVLRGTVVALLSLERGEHGTWSLHLVEDLGVLNSVRNCLIHLLHFVPLLLLDECTSLLEPVDDLGVVKGKGDLRNLDVLFLGPINSIVGEVIESPLKFDLNIELELLNLAHWVRWVKIVIDKFFINSFSDVELNRVVASCDCLYVKVDILGLLQGLFIVEIDNCVQVDEHSRASCQEAEDHSVVGLRRWQCTRCLDEQEGLPSTFAIWVGVELLDVLAWLLKVQSAALLACA